MLDIAEMKRFPNLEQQVDRDDKVPVAEAAVAVLREWTENQREAIREQEEHAATIADNAKRAQQSRLFNEDHEALKRRFYQMHDAADPTSEAGTSRASSTSCSPSTTWSRGRHTAWSMSRSMVPSPSTLTTTLLRRSGGRKPSAAGSWTSSRPTSSVRARTRLVCTSA